MFFKKRPVTIEAREFSTNNDDGTCLNQLCDWINSYKKDTARHDNTNLYINTLEGEMWAERGDWIIKGVHDEFYPCKPDIFDKTYTKVPDTENAHIEDLLNWLHSEVLSAGGDGDAIWITSYYKIEGLLPIVEKLNKEQWNNWWNITVKDTTIHLDHDQEGFSITTDQNFGVPCWSQCTIRW